MNLQFDRLVADRGESDEDYVSGPDHYGTDVIDDNNEVVNAELVDDEDMYLIDDVVPGKASERKEKAAKTNVEVEVVLEMSVSESEDGPKKQARGKVVEGESEVEIDGDSEPKPPPRKNPKAKALIRDAIKDRKIIGTSVKNMGPDIIRRTTVKNEEKIT